MTEPASEPRPAAKKAAVTGYVLLELSEDTGDWILSGDGVTASSATAAIKAHVGNSAAIGAGGTFVAIPERSWRPVTVKTKTTVALVLEDAK